MSNSIYQCVCKRVRLKFSVNVYRHTNRICRLRFSCFARVTLKAPITTKFDCFCRLLKVLEAFPTNSVDSDQTTPIGAV